MGLLRLMHPDPARVVNQILIMRLGWLLAIITIRATVPPFGHDLKMRIEKLALSDEEELSGSVVALS